MIRWNDYNGERCDNPRCQNLAAMRFLSGATPLNPKRAVWVCDAHAPKLFDAVRDEGVRERHAIQEVERQEEFWHAHPGY